MALKFKVGDEVKVIGRDSGIDKGSECFKIGTIAIIEKVDEDDELYTYKVYANGDWFWYHEESLELYEGEHEFKVGDRVRIRQWDDMAAEFKFDGVGDIHLTHSTFVSNMKHLCGRTATVIGVEENNNKHIYLDFDNKRGNTDWYYSTYMVEPLKHEYKVGDKVVTTKLKDHQGNELFPVGTVAEIEEIKMDGRELTYRLVGPGNYWWYNEDMFKPYEEPIEPEPPKAEPPKAEPKRVTVRSYEDMLREVL